VLSDSGNEYQHRTAQRDAGDRHSMDLSIPGTNTSGWRDYNDNSVQDPDGNPYNIPGFSGGPSSPTPGRSPRYADQARAKEP